MRRLITILVLIITTNGYANVEPIPEILSCTVQEFTDIGISTNTTESLSIHKTAPTKAIKVIYERINKDQVMERYAYGSDLEVLSLYKKGYTGGGTQYLNAENKNEVITYFGKQGEYYIVVKFVRMAANDGGVNDGWRTDSFFNIRMACVSQNG